MIDNCLVVKQLGSIATESIGSMDLPTALMLYDILVSNAMPLENVFATLEALILDYFPLLLSETIILNEETLLRLIGSDLWRLNENQILEYVIKWCGANDSPTDSKKRRKGRSFTKFENYIR